MTPPSSPQPAMDHGKDAFEDLTDRLIGSIPEHIWVVIIAVVLMFAFGRIFTTTTTTTAPSPDAEGEAAIGETLEGWVNGLLPLPAPANAEEAGPQASQRVRIEITRGSQAAAPDQAGKAARDPANQT